MFCAECSNFLDISNNVTAFEMTTNDAKTMTEYDISKINVLIEKVLNGEAIEPEEIATLDIERVYENETFVKLDKKKKTLVVHKLFKNSKTNNSATVFFCNSCGHTEPIKNKTIIYQDNVKLKPPNLTYYKYDKTFPTTKKYNCFNVNCETHKNEKIKMATFFKLNPNSYVTTYLCNVCDTDWNI